MVHCASSLFTTLSDQAIIVGWLFAYSPPTTSAVAGKYNAVKSCTGDVNKNIAALGEFYLNYFICPSKPCLNSNAIKVIGNGP